MTPDMTCACPTHWFGRTTSTKTVAAILEANGIPKAVVKSVKGMFGRRERIVVRPGYELRGAHYTSPCHVQIHAANVHIGMSVCTTAPDTDALRRLVEACHSAGLLVRFHTFDCEDFVVCVGKGQAPESFRPGDDAWTRWIRERMPRWYTETMPEYFKRTTAESIALANQSASDIRAKVSADLKAMTIEAVKGTSLTIIDAIGGTAQQTIDGLRADPEFAEVALRAQLGCAPCSARAQGPLSVVREDPMQGRDSMTPALIKAVLALPLPVRLALLDADPTGPGWDINDVGAGVSVTLYESPNDRGLATSAKVVRRHVEQGSAWLPCNPLAVIEVAARLLAQRHGLTPSIELLGPDGAEGEPEWTCRLVLPTGGDHDVEAAGSREEIGVLVLREVYCG